MAELSPDVDAVAAFAPYMSALLQARSRYPEGSAEYAEMGRLIAYTSWEIASLTGVFRGVVLALGEFEAVSPC